MPDAVIGRPQVNNNRLLGACGRSRQSLASKDWTRAGGLAMACISVDLRGLGSTTLQPTTFRVLILGRLSLKVWWLSLQEE